MNNKGKKVGDDSAISKLIGKMVDANQSTLEQIMETKIKRVIREELDFYFEKMNRRIDEALRSGGTVPASGRVNQPSSQKIQNETFETEGFDGDLDYNIEEIRKRIAEQHNPMKPANTVPQTLQGNGNANKIADEQGNMIDVPENPELDKKIKRDYSDFI